MSADPNEMAPAAGNNGGHNSNNFDDVHSTFGDGSFQSDNEIREVIPSATESVVRGTDSVGDRLIPLSFEPEFAGPTDYAYMYRQLGLQVVPSYHPSEAKSWKRPLLSSWKEFETTLVPDSQFEKWWGPDGSHRHKTNMGLITGDCSNDVFVLDVDLHTKPEAQAWLVDLLDSYNDGKAFDCPCQQTGGGGFQYLFRAPGHWPAPTMKTPIGIDIRGQGGFAVLAPSMHESGREYQWVQGKAPWEVEIPEAPPWLLMAIDDLVRNYGAGANRDMNGGEGGMNRVVTATPDSVKNDFGMVVDGREGYILRIVFARLVSLYRESPIMPSKERLQDELRDAFNVYARNSKSRIHEPGTPNAVLLEREGRGHTEFTAKWNYLLKQWDTKVADAAAQPAPSSDWKSVTEQVNEMAQRTKADGADANKPTQSGAQAEERSEFDPDPNLYEVLNLEQIKCLPDPVFIVEGVLIRNALGFVYGAPGAGKSFVLLSLGLSVASQQASWWERQINAHGYVLMISSEGVADMKHRIAAWEKGTGITISDPTRFHLIRQTINFMDEGDELKLHRTIADLVQRVGEKPMLVFVDTLSRAMPGADENDQASASRMIQACDRVREAWETTVVCAHHTSRAGNMRGSTVFEGAADVILSVEREEGAQSGILTAKKIKAAADGWKQQFNLRKINIVSGDKCHESLIAELASAPEQTEDEWPERHTVMTILDQMQEAWDRKEPWSSKPQTRKEGRYAPVHFMRFGVSEEIAEKLLMHMLDTQTIIYDTCDQHSKMKGLRPKEYRSRSGANPYEK